MITFILFFIKKKDLSQFEIDYESLDIGKKIGEGIKFFDFNLIFYFCLKKRWICDCA